MSLTTTTYRAEIADVSADGKYIRVLKDVDGPHSHLRPEQPTHITRLNEEQARNLRDSLDEVLERL